MAPTQRPNPWPGAAARAAGPPLVAAAHPHLRNVAPRGYSGFPESAEPRRVSIPATAAVPLIVKLKDSQQRPPQFVKGAQASCFTPAGACAPSYLSVWLAPLSAYTLLGVPLHELAGQTVDLGDVLGAAGRRLGDRLRDAPTWHRRFALLDEFLMCRLERGPEPSPEVREAWQLLVSSGGAAPIARVAGDVGWSHKHLITRFRQQLGVTPKAAARLVRFAGLRRRLHSSRSPDWARLAAEAGFADQAHLIREFRRFTGTTPTGYLARIPAPGRQPG